MPGEAAVLDAGTPPEVTSTEGGAVSQPTGEPGGGGQPGGTAQPTGQPGAEPKAAGEPGAPPAAEGEPHVPWARFREAQTARTQAMREMQQRNEDWTKKEQDYQSQLEELRGGSDQQKQIVQDYEEISRLLQANPDIARALMQRLGEGGIPTNGVPGQPWAGHRAAPAQPATSPEMKKFAEIAERLEQRLTQQEKSEIEAERTRRNTETDRQLDDACVKFLEPRGYDRSFLEDAKEHVLKMAAKYPDLEMEDVPFVLGTWFKGMSTKIQGQVNKFLEGKKQDAGLPPSPGGAAPPVRTETPAGANDAQTSQRLKEDLSRLGWSNNG